MSDIFIGYALPDQERAKTIVDALRGAGHSVWWDRDVPAGAERNAAVGEALAAAKYALILWSNSSAKADDVIDEAELARGKGTYIGVLLDPVELPFGFSGYPPLDASPYKGSAAEAQRIVAGVRNVIETGVAGPEALPPPPPPPPPPVNYTPYVAGVVVAVLVAVIAFFLFRSAGPTEGDKVREQLAVTPCAWLRVDPVVDGKNGTLGLMGAAGDPAAAQKTIREIVAEQKLAIKTVSIDKVAQIDGRECATIDGLRSLRKSEGGRLIVTGEPFILDTALRKPQALSRVNIALKDEDQSMAMFGVEPSGVVTWALPDLAAIDKLKTYDVGYTSPGKGRHEFNIYTDHLGWTGIFLVVGDRPLAATQPQGKVQSASEFAQTLKAATAQGKWDADMVWFRIDPKQ